MVHFSMICAIDWQMRCIVVSHIAMTIEKYPQLIKFLTYLIRSEMLYILTILQYSVRIGPKAVSMDSLIHHKHKIFGRFT